MGVSRRNFMKGLALSGVYGSLSSFNENDSVGQEPYPKKSISAFCRHLKPVGRILEMEGWYVWCNSPIEGPDGKIHIFFSRWPEKYKMGGWIHQCEIAHAIADSPRGPYQFIDIALAPREGYFDATTCHNPHIQYVDGVYCLFYMGNSNGKTNTKRIGLATANSLYGPWKRMDSPLIEPSETSMWDDHCTTNPAFIKHPNGQYWLYYKSWNTKEYEDAAGAKIKANRKYGLAIANDVRGPYLKYEGNPVIDFQGKGANRQLEDAYVWREDNKFKLIARDMGFFDHNVGLYFESKDGIHWPEPAIAYYGTQHYINQPPAPAHLTRYGRFERPQLLIQNEKPSYLFTTSQGGKYMTASGFVFEIR